MDDFTNTQDLVTSDDVAGILVQPNLNSRSVEWLGASEVEVDLTQEEELVDESVVDEIVVDQGENVNYIECLDVEECVEESIVYVFDESVVEFDINEPTYIIEEDPSFFIENDQVDTMNYEPQTTSQIMINSNMEEISIAETEQLDFSTDCVNLVNICNDAINISDSVSDGRNKDEADVVSEISSTTVGNLYDEDVNKTEMETFQINDIACKTSETELLKSDSDYKTPEIDCIIVDNDSNVSDLNFKQSDIPHTLEVQLLSSPKRVIEPTLSCTPPNMLPSVLNKIKLNKISPISDVNSSIDNISPGSTISDINPSPTVRPAVLGREQIKKRLQSFSLFKQGIHALPIKKVLAVKPPKIQVQTSEEVDENGKKKIVILKKPPKQGTNAQEKAKSVIDEIEQIKRDEAMALEVKFGYSHGYIKNSSLSNLHSSRDYDHSNNRKSKSSADRESSNRNSSSSKSFDKSYRDNKRYDREHSRNYRHKSEEDYDKKKTEHRHKSEDDYEKKKNVKDEAMQNYWHEVKKKYNEHKKSNQVSEKSAKIEESKDKYKDDKYKEEDKYKKEDTYRKDDKYKDEERYKMEVRYKEEDTSRKEDKFKEEERYKKEIKIKEENKYKKEEKYREEEKYKKENNYKVDENFKSESKLKDDEKYKKEEKYREEDRHKKDKEDKEDEMPLNWQEVKKKSIDFNKISKIKEKTMHVSIEESHDRFQEDDIKAVMYKREDYIKPQLIFEYPSLPRHPIIALSITGKSKYYPPEIVRFTEKHPFLSYCEKPQNARGYYRTRKQTFNEIPHDRMDTMLQIIENKTESPVLLDSGIPTWYPAQDYLIESKLKEVVVQSEPETITSYGLSVLTENYNDDEELETLVEELLEEAIQPENKPEEARKSEEKETSHRSKKAKKHKKHSKKSKSRSRSKEKKSKHEGPTKSKKHEEEEKEKDEKSRERSSEKSRERSSEKSRERSSEKSRERSSDKSRERSSEKSREKSGEVSSKKSSDKFREQSSEVSGEMPSENARQRSAEKSKEKFVEKSRDNCTEKIIENSTEKSLERLDNHEKILDKSISKYEKRSEKHGNSLDRSSETNRPLEKSSEKQKSAEKPKKFDIFDVPTEKELLDDKTPNTDEYRSNWESEEDVLTEILREDIPYNIYTHESKWEIEELHPRYEDKRNRRRKSSERSSQERNRRRMDEKRKHRNSYEEKLSEFDNKRSADFKQIEDKLYHQLEYNNRWSSEEDLNKSLKYDKKRYISSEKSSKPRKPRGTDGLLKLTASARRTNWSSDEEFSKKNPFSEFEKRNKLNFEDRKYNKRDSEPRNSFKPKPDSRWEEEHKQIESSKIRNEYDVLFGKEFLNFKSHDRKHGSKERNRSSDKEDSSRKKKKDEKKRKEKEKKRKNKDKDKTPKVQINYSDLEENLDEEFRSDAKKKKDLIKEEDKFSRYKAKIKIDYSDFDMSLIESTDNYNRKFEEPKPVSEEETLEETKKVVSKTDKVQQKTEVEKPKVSPEEVNNIEIKIKEEIVISPKHAATTSEQNSFTPIAAPPVLPIPVPFSNTSKPETSSKLASEYEEFMKAVTFDETPKEASISHKDPKDNKLGITKLELPPSKINEESEKEDTSSDSDSESSESEPSESSYESSDADLDLTVANIKTEKVSDTELEINSPQMKRKRSESDLEIFNPNIEIKSEKLEVVKKPKTNLFENDDSKFNVIDWENSYTETNTYFDIFTNKTINTNIIPLKNPIIDITDIIVPTVLPENIPLPSEGIITSPKESIISVSDSQNSTPVKKLRSLIPIKLLTPEHRLKAIETAKLEEEVIVIDEKTNQSVVSSSDGHAKDELEDLELWESRKRQSNWNLNITPTKKPMLQSSALCDDSDEDFTDKLIKNPEKVEKKIGADEVSDISNKEDIFIENSPVKQLRQSEMKLTKSIEGLGTEKTRLEKSDFNPDGFERIVLEKSELDKFDIETSRTEKWDPDVLGFEKPDSNRFRHEQSMLDNKKSPDRKLMSRLDSKKTPDRSSRDRHERNIDRKRERSRERSRDRVKRKTLDRRDRRQVPRGRSRYSRDREIKVQSRDSQEHNRDRARSRENERKSKERDHKLAKSSRWDDTRRDDPRRLTRSPSPKMSRSSLERIPIPMRLDDTDFSATSMDIVQSPVNSPLDGFKRSLADSTISDSELITQLNTPEESNEPSPRYQQPYFSNLKELPKTESPCSPKRISLDDRINLVLGIDKEPPKQIDTVCTRGPYQHPPPNYHPDSYGYTGRSDYDMYNQPGQSDNFGSYSNPYHQQTYYPNQLNSDNNIKVLQVGNMIQVVPIEQPIPSPVVAPVSKVQEAQTKVVQVGNMLQIVPMTIEPPVVVSSPKPSPASILPIAIEKVIVSSAPSKSTETLVAERRAEKEKRRQEREQRRKEKEKKQKEKEKRKQLKIKLKTENMIKRALMLETGEGDMDISNIENEEDKEDGVLSLPWPPASGLVTLPLPKAPSKGILVTHGYKKEKDDSSDEYTEVRKVKFADGICPGEGTSPSGGEELPSPPPPPRKLPKEKRYKKMKTKNKKKIKVKIIRTQQPPAEEEAESEDNLPPPPPPPGSPPPHLWPPRIKTHINNIHPSLPPNVYPPNPYPAPPPQMYPAAYNGPTQPPPIVMGPGHPQQIIRHHPPVIPIIPPHGGVPSQPPLHHGPHHGAPFHH